MKVLICIPCLLTGGTEIQTLSLAKALIAAGHEVTTVCYFEHTPQMISRYQDAGSEVILLSKNGIRPAGVKKTLCFLYVGLKQAVKSSGPDVAHVQYMAPGAIPIVILRWLGVKRIIATTHTPADIYPSLHLLHFLTKYVLVAFTCITERAERSFFNTSQLYAIGTPLKKRGNHFTIYNSLPTHVVTRKEKRLYDEYVTIGVVSRLEYIKGMDLVIPAFAQIHKDFPHARLLIVGDGSLRALMEKQAVDLEPEAMINFVGRQNQDDLQPFYDQIDILLMPSRSEGFGLTAIEGMARGCVVVAAATGGLPEVIKNGTTGLLHLPESIEDLAGKIAVLMGNKNVLATYSENAIQQVERFSFQRFSALFADLYNAISHRL